MIFNLFQHKIAQLSGFARQQFLKFAQIKPDILYKVYKVPEEFTAELAELLVLIDDKKYKPFKKVLMDGLKSTPITGQDQIDEIKKSIEEEVSKQSALESTQDAPKEESEIDKKISRVTSNPKYRLWIKNLFESKNIVEDDFVGLQILLNDFTKLVDAKKIAENKRDISKIENYQEMIALVNKFAECKAIDVKEIAKQDGCTLLDSNEKVKMFEVTKEQTLKKLCDTGYYIRWCVIHGSWSTYPPPKFYLFFINDRPEVLAHHPDPKQQYGISQIKDIDDVPLQHGMFISLIRPFIDKFNLNNKKNDFAVYDAQLKKIDDFKAHVDDKDFITKELEITPLNITLLSPNKWGNYLGVVCRNLNRMNFSFVPQDLLDQIARYCIINNLDDEFTIVEDNMINLLRKNDNFSRYHKIIPEKLRTARVSSEYKSIIDDILQTIIDTGYPPRFADVWCSDKWKFGKDSDPLKQAMVKCVNDSIKLKGVPPPFAEAGCLDQLTNGTASKELINAVDEYIMEKGEAPKFAAPWCTEKLNSGSYPEKWDVGIFKYVLNSSRNETPKFATEWCITQLPKKELPDDVVEIIVGSISRTGESPKFAKEWCQEKLRNNTAPISLQKVVNNQIQSTGKAPSCAKEWCAETLNDPNKEKPQAWLIGIENFMLKNNFPPAFAEEWCKNKLEEGSAPPSWLTVIKKVIMNRGAVPLFAYDWSQKQVLSKKNALADTINAYVKEHGEVPQFVTEAKEQSTEVSEEWIAGVANNIRKEKDFPESIRERCQEMMDSDNPPQEWIDIVKSFIANKPSFVPVFAEKWCEKQLIQGTPPPGLMGLIYNKIYNSNYPPPYAVKWCSSQLNSIDKAPVEGLVNVITLCIDKFKTPPMFAKAWCKNMLDAGMASPKMIQSVKNVTVLLGRPPDFAREWYAKNNRTNPFNPFNPSKSTKETKETKEIVNACHWYNLYKIGFFDKK